MKLLNKLLFSLPLLSIALPTVLTSCSKEVREPIYFIKQDPDGGHHYTLYFYETKRPDSQNNGVVNVIVDITGTGDCHSFFIDNKYEHNGATYFVEHVILGAGVREDRDFSSWTNMTLSMPRFYNPKVNSINTFEDPSINQKVRTILSFGTMPYAYDVSVNKSYNFYDYWSGNSVGGFTYNLIPYWKEKLPSLYYNNLYIFEDYFAYSVDYYDNNKWNEIKDFFYRFYIASDSNNFLQSFYEMNAPICHVNYRGKPDGTDNNETNTGVFIEHEDSETEYLEMYMPQYKLNNFEIPNYGFNEEQQIIQSGFRDSYISMANTIRTGTHINTSLNRKCFNRYTYNNIKEIPNNWLYYYSSCFEYFESNPFSLQFPNLELIEADAFKSERENTLWSIKIMLPAKFKDDPAVKNKDPNLTIKFI
ncbi:hypothetical protein [Malacoplasma muris]|uniref:hypothetical protein n=1 Tax=Malacoplasma muris TaxID=2119 RepID=UPI00398E345B